MSVIAGVNNIFGANYYARIRSDGIDPQQTVMSKRRKMHYRHPLKVALDAERHRLCAKERLA